ncbi:glutaminase A [Halofilum ochraceum]|uniref:glutaminase A n=1 Tax=Halofilum ochraceum TaxID=1611323 RepID=UPI00082BBE32|nr:glutaminase A [Halofilum ochraceum]
MSDDTDIEALLEEALEVGRAAAGAGEVAHYIPELAKSDPSHVGIAIATVDGGRYEVGDARVPFTFQSVSKVFSLALVLREHGPEVLDEMACEPSGDAFHSIVRLEEEQGRPRNPYINAGAILVSGLLPGGDPVAKVASLQSFLGEVGDGAEFRVDDEVFNSEVETGYRNRALANYLRHFGLLDDPQQAVETYFRQCSISLDAVRLARIGLFLANRGVDPVSGETVLARADNRVLVSQMAMCGLYDDVGRFAIDVGVPAKSGVSGAILAVVPDRMSITAFGPALGPKGNSTAALAALAHLSRRLDLSLY